MEYYSALKKEGNLTFATAWMDLDSVMLSEISLSEKDKLIDTENKLTAVRGEGVKEWVKNREGIKQ